MHHLVESALQEAGIDGAYRTHALACQPGGEGNGVLFGYAHIKKTLRHLACQQVQTCPVRHCGGNADNARVFPAKFQHRAAKDVGI